MAVCFKSIASLLLYSPEQHRQRCQHTPNQSLEIGGVAVSSRKSKAGNQCGGCSLDHLHTDRSPAAGDHDRGRLVCWWHASPSPVQQMTQQRTQWGVSSNHPCKGIAWPWSSILGPLQDVLALLPYPTGPESHHISNLITGCESTLDCSKSAQDSRVNNRYKRGFLYFLQ